MLSVPNVGPLSKCWHQILRQPYTNHASFLINRILRLPKGSLIARYANLITVFFISGVLHTIAEVGGGVPWYQSGTTRFYCTQALGIMLEDAVIAACHSARPREWNSLVLILIRSLGHSWVIAVLLWTSPAWFYPVMAQPFDAKFLPFSIITNISAKR